MKSGIELINEERQEQLGRHGRTIDQDVKFNNLNQLAQAASILASENWGCNDAEDMVEYHCPPNWDEKLWEKMVNKDYKERLIVSGALIAAELDRLNAIEETNPQ